MPPKANSESPANCRMPSGNGPSTDHSGAIAALLRTTQQWRCRWTRSTASSTCASRVIVLLCCCCLLLLLLLLLFVVACDFSVVLFRFAASDFSAHSSPKRKK